MKNLLKSNRIPADTAEAISAGVSDTLQDTPIREHLMDACLFMLPEKDMFCMVFGTYSDDIA